MQFKKFMDIAGRLEERGLKIPIKHVCNSAGVMEFPEYHLDMVRPGIVIYGHYPSEEVDKTKLDLKPAMELKAVITHLSEKEKGIRVSYGGTYQTHKELTKIATVPIGYADGYLRSLSNNADMIAGGKRVPVIGRICMDQCMIDVTGVNNITVGDEVIIFGKRGDEEITVTELAANMGTINYEILCVIGRRIPRVYLKNGKIVNVLSYLK
jgi:alanine racemase